MQVHSVTQVKGPMLLAKAGVSLADAQWLYAQRRHVPVSGAAPVDAERFSRIRSQVQTWLRDQVVAASQEVVYA